MYIDAATTVDGGYGENVVDESEQHVAVVHDHPDDLLFLLWGLQHRQHITEADDGIQRGTDLVRHVRHKHTLHASRVLGTLRLLLQLLLFLDERCHITDDTIGTQLLAILIVIGHTVDDVPLQRLAFMEERMTEGQFCLWLLQSVLRVEQVVLEGTLYKVRPQLLEVHRWHGGFQTFIEGHGLVSEVGSPEAHVTTVHQILDLVLEILDLLIGAPHLQSVLLTLQIEGALLGDITDGEGDIDQGTLFVVDGVYTDLRIAVHVAVHDDCLRTEIEFLGMSVGQHFPEDRHVVERLFKIIGIVLRLELQDLSHLLVDREQMTFLVIERQTHQRLFESLAVFVGQLVFLPFLEDLFGLVCQRTEDVDGCLETFYILCHALVVHITPLSGMLISTDIPAEDTLSRLSPFMIELGDKAAIVLLILRVHILEALLIPHTCLRQELPMEVITPTLAQVKSHHVVGVHVEGMLHDIVDLLTFFHAPANAQNTDMIDAPSGDEGQGRQGDHQYRGGIEETDL